MTHRTFWIKVAFLLFIAGCAKSGQLPVENSSVQRRKPPKIKACMDLGGLRATVGGHFNEEESDKRFTPGEWMAVVGKHLNDPSAEVRIGGSPVALESMMDEGLLVRLPRGLSPFETATITVRTSAGQDSFDIKPQSYLIVSDTGGGAVRFFRTAVTPSEDSLFEPECDHVALERARFHAVSRTGALLYAVAGAKESASETPPPRELLVIHLGAKDHPRLLKNIPFATADRPTAMAIDETRTHLILSTQTELLVFDVQTEEDPVLLSRISLSHEKISKGGYDKMVLVDGGAAGVLLDGLANRLTVVDLSQKSAPTVKSHLDVPGGELPRLIDMVADLSDKHAIHVLQGPNLRLAKEMFHRFLPKLMAHLKSDELNRRSRLLTFRLEENALRQTNEVGMPERTIPLHLAALSGGGVLVNAADFSVTELSDASGIVDNLRAVLGVLLSAVQIGSVLSVDPKGNITTVAEGISLFLTTAQIPGRNDFVSLVMRIAVKEFPPSVGVKLSIDTLNPDGRREGELLLRNLERSFILPPYDTPDLSFQ